VPLQLLQSLEIKGTDLTKILPGVHLLQRVPSGGLKRIGSTKILRAAVTAAWERAGTGATSKEID